jgi:hypothetical protein
MTIRKILIRVFLSLLAVVAAVLVVRAVLNLIEGRKLERALSDLKAQGLPLTIGELLAPCSEGDNGAALWKAAEDLYDFAGEDAGLFTQAYQNYVREVPMTPGMEAALTRLIERNRRVLDLIPEIAGKPCFRYEDADVRAWERRMPNAAKMLRAVRLWCLESIRIAERGDLDGAVDRLRTGLRFSPKIAEEPMLIAYLVALAEVKDCLLALNRALSGREAGGDLLLFVHGDLDDRLIEQWKAHFRNGIRSEAVQFLDIGRAPSAKTLASSWGIKSRPARLYFWLIRPLIKRDLRLRLPIYFELEAQAVLPYYRTRDFWERHRGQLEDLPWYAVLSKNMIPNMEAAVMKSATFDALVLTARAGLACRIYKLRTGHYPETLDVLVGSLLSQVPVDPFTGDPLVYRREGNGFIVYSLGSNLRDDGGRSTWEITQMVMDKDDDWTWREAQ